MLGEIHFDSEGRDKVVVGIDWWATLPAVLKVPRFNGAVPSVQQVRNPEAGQRWALLPIMENSMGYKYESVEELIRLADERLASEGKRQRVGSEVDPRPHEWSD